jgi:predicted GIY-YIG superfamily endonuclease
MPTHNYVFYIVYCVAPDQRTLTYEGITNNLAQRLRKHRGEIKGGAKFTTRYTNQGCHWILGATAHGFRDHHEVLQFEYAIHNPRRSKHLKVRTNRNANHYTRNVSNMFFLSNKGHYAGHIWGAVHSAPQASRIDLLEEKIHNFISASTDLLLNPRRYAEFAQIHNPYHGTPVAKPQALTARGQHYREQARRLLEAARRRGGYLTPAISPPLCRQ